MVKRTVSVGGHVAVIVTSIETFNVPNDNDTFHQCLIPAGSSLIKFAASASWIRVDVFGPPMFERAHDRSDFRVAERADRAARDVLA